VLNSPHFGYRSGPCRKENFKLNGENMNTKTAGENENDKEDEGFEEVEMNKRREVDVNVNGWSNMLGHEVTLLWQFCEEGEAELVELAPEWALRILEII
jgi:hypothetical protein